MCIRDSYQMAFHGQPGRWPTWDDALAHCDGETHAAWAAGLREHGIEIAPRERPTDDEPTAERTAV